jgi:hypothetical protein
MAREPRWKRSGYSRVFADMLKTTAANKPRQVFLTPPTKDDPYYLLVLFPNPNIPSVSYDHYREKRRFYLEACCKIARLEYPDAKDIIGIATEPGLNNDGRSEDAAYLDGREWTPAMEEEAKELQERLGVFRTPKRKNIHLREYPEILPTGMKPKNPRNKKCPCGSGKKYKHCCLKK